ncbi:MAG: HEPN domain-containing protein [Fibrobacterales bacterium]
MPQEWQVVGDKEDLFETTGIQSIITMHIDRFIHVYGEFEYSEDKCKDIISNFMEFVFGEKLIMDIKIPILFLNFDFESYELTEGIKIQKLSEGEHLARFEVKNYNLSVHDSVLQSATHALVLEHYAMSNNAVLWDFKELKNKDIYPKEIIEQFFSALRICTNYKTGYAQILAVADHWHALCKADLPYIDGVSTRSYSSELEDYYWNMPEVPIISSATLNDIQNLFIKLKEISSNSVQLATKRLNRCLTRDNEEDAVIDATIALEALLVDETSEMTHKLAMRGAALSQLSPEITKSPDKVFKDIKSIYTLRSTIVHGSTITDKKRLLQVSENKKIPVLDQAIEYLRIFLKILILNPHYLKPIEIDNALLKGEIGEGEALYL